MQKAVLCAVPDSEDQIEDRTECRRFARLVRAIDNVQVGRPNGTGAEIENRIGEFAVPRQVEAIDTQLFNPAVLEPRKDVRCALACKPRHETFKRFLVVSEYVPKLSGQLAPQLVGDGFHFNIEID